ncbi:YncE family protein [Erythrobacter sp. EC-HK427]|uniref:YncE family protein n=1 Tax=Erythrobacter sp. EC-HK427 TaxID=2038396 RepID=UPI001255F512|nr:YncE family protein [Erythrobacter sp. EC-HK427]VVT13579.1 conserved exported hypothetical protein [Erythrobacter sp. EC-HK427]
MKRLTLFAAALALASCAQEPARQFDPPEGTLFVANKYDGSLSRIDLFTGEETHRAQTCDDNHELTISPDEHYVAVMCYTGRTIEIYATADLAPVRTVELPDGALPHAAHWVRDDRLIVSAEGRGSMIFVDFPAGLDGKEALTEFGGVDGPPWPTGAHLFAVSPDVRFAFGTVIPRGDVVRYDLANAADAASRRIGETVGSPALSPDGESLWVASHTDNQAIRLDPLTLDVLAEVETGALPIRLAFHPSGDFLVSSNFAGGDLTVIDVATNEVVRTIEVSGDAAAEQVNLIFSADGTRIYASETASGTIAEIDWASGQLRRRLAAGAGGDGIALIE